MVPHRASLVATCWAYDADNVLCYEVQANGQAMPKAAIKHEAPVLCSAWSADGSAVFSGGCDNQVKWDLATNQSTQVAQHEAPVRHCAWINEVNLLVTGSWDKTLKYWDTRQPNPAMQVQLPSGATPCPSRARCSWWARRSATSRCTTCRTPRGRTSS